MKRIAVIQHTQSEWLGHIEDHLEGRGIGFTYARPFTAGGKLPAADAFEHGVILVGGGPWGSATPGRILPTLDAEVRIVRACLMQGRPVIGIGLGAQILSLAADGGSEPAALEFHVGDARRVRPGALGGLLPDRFPNAVYMRDRPVPPAYAHILAVDDQDRPTLFQIGGNAFGFSGHPGIRRAMIEDLLMESDDTPDDVGAGLEQLLTRGTALEDALVPVMTGLIRHTGWMVDAGEH